MAFGQVQSINAPPQPGTSNLPYPANKLPAFVPVTTNVIDNYAVSVGNEAAVLTALIDSLLIQLGNGFAPLTIAGVLSGVNDSLSRTADTKTALYKALCNLNIAIGSEAASKAGLASTLSIKAANNVTTNNFYVAASPDKPEMPPIPEQLKSSIVDGRILQSQSAVAGAVTGAVDKGVSQVGNWITGSKTYQTVAKWIEDTTEALGTAISSSARSILAKIKGGT